MNPHFLTLTTIAALSVASLSVTTAQEAYDTNALLIEAEKIIVRDTGCFATVRVVSKNRMGGLGIQLGKMSEGTQEAAGTVIDAAGTIVVPLSALESPMGALSFSLSVDGEDKEINGSAEISKLTAEFDDGREFDVEIIIEDPDLDIAILRPVEMVEDAKFIDLSTAAEIDDLKRFDPIITASRLSENLGREVVARPSFIDAVVDKGRRLVVVRGSRKGAPVYNGNGTLLGIVAAAPAPDKSSGGGLGGMIKMASAMGETVIVPAAAIAELATNAEDAPAEEGQ